MEISDNNQHMGKGKNWNLFEAKNKTQIQNEHLCSYMLWIMLWAIVHQKKQIHINSKPGL